MLIETLRALGRNSSEIKLTEEIFIEQNPQTAFLVFVTGQRTEHSLINGQFFRVRGLEQSLAAAFPETYREQLRRAANGETVLINVSPFLKSPGTAFLFPWRGGALAYIFSPEKLNESFGFGTNQSMLINDSGDILVHADSEPVKNALNIANNDFVIFIRENQQRNAQTVYTDIDGLRYFGAFTKLNIAGAVVITSIEYDTVFEGIAATTRRNIYLTVAVIAVAIICVLLYAKSISVPLKDLTDASYAIERGRFNIQLKKWGRSEIGVLTASFERMAKALTVFGRFTNKDVAIRAMTGEIKPGGTSKHATILFTDMRSFTKKSERFTNTFGASASEKIVIWLNDYFTRMVECVEKSKGVVDKFSGDGLMAHWGTVHSAGSPQKDAVNCVMTALMMRKALYDMNRKRDPNDPGNPPIQIGCGINTGIVTAGQIGSEIRMDYTVIGDPVNLASRTEALCKENQVDILITEDTWTLVKNYFITEEIGSVQVRGREKPVKIYAVINYAGINKGPQTISDVKRLFGAAAPVVKNNESKGGATLIQPVKKAPIK